jgi:hypothetical protein
MGYFVVATDQSANVQVRLHLGPVLEDFECQFQARETRSCLHGNANVFVAIIGNLFGAEVANIVSIPFLMRICNHSKSSPILADYVSLTLSRATSVFARLAGGLVRYSAIMAVISKGLPKSLESYGS